MKRVVFLLILALVSCLGASAAFSQGWTPGPPMSAAPQTGVPVPVMGQPCPMPMPMPMPDPSCMPMPPCQPLPCGPTRSASAGALVGYQLNQDAGFIKFSSNGHHLIQKTGTKINLNLAGLLVGASTRVQMSDCAWVRAEYRHLFSNTNKVENVTTALNVGDPGNRSFTNSHYYSDVLDGSVGYCVSPGVSVIGGFRWDSMYLVMNHTQAINLFSSPVDEGDVTLSSLQPYAGAEFTWNGCDTGIMFKVIGTPWQSTSTKFGLTFGNGGNTERGPIRDSISATSKYASFVEATLSVAKKLSCNVSVGAFGMLTALSAHSEKNMSSTRLAGLDPTFPEVTVSYPFDVDMNRRNIVLGGNGAVSFNSPF
jgi:hypothetical protein